MSSTSDIHQQEAFVTPSSWYKTLPAEDATQDDTQDEIQTHKSAKEPASAVKLHTSKPASSTKQVKPKFRLYDKHENFLCYARDLNVTSNRKPDLETQQDGAKVTAKRAKRTNKTISQEDIDDNEDDEDD